MLDHAHINTMGCCRIHHGKKIKDSGLPDIAQQSTNKCVGLIFERPWQKKGIESILLFQTFMPSIKSSSNIPSCRRQWDMQETMGQKIHCDPGLGS